MIRKVEHVVLIVTDMVKLIEYYSKMFGFKLCTRGETKTKELAFLYHENQQDFEIELIHELTFEGGYSPKGTVNHLAFTS